MIYSLRHPLLSVALAVIVALLVPAHPSAAGTLAQPAPQTADELCSMAEAAAQQAEQEEPSRSPRLVREERDLAAGAPLPPRLCLLHYPAFDLYRAVIVPADSTAQFRAAKAEAVRRLSAARLELCRVAVWLGVHRPPPVLDDDDRYGLPGECMPAVVAGDGGAAPLLPQVREAVARVVELTATQMEWRPDRALTILVYTDRAAAVARAVRGAPEEHRDHWAQLTSAGQPALRETTFGYEILLPLWDLRGSPEAQRVAIERVLIHEYTHFAQFGMAGGLTAPYWFIEGQAVYQEYRNAGRATPSVAIATRAQQSGRVVPLAELTRPAEWYRHEQALGRSEVYSRAYAAVEWLVERHGFGATVRLLRDNRDGSPERFHELLAQLTGMDIHALDRALASWLTSPGRLLAAEERANQNRAVLFRDDFSNPHSGWPRESDDPTRRRAGYEAGEYYVTRLVGSGGAPVVIRTEPLADFQAQIDARLMPPTEGGYFFVSFRAQENGDRYELAVDPNNTSFRLRRVVGDRASTLIPWTSTPALAGGSAPDRVGVRAHGPEIVVLINGQEVGRAHDEVLREGGLGFGVNHVRDDWAEVRLRNVLVTRPE